MTLTVCIPIYNQDVTALVYALLKQTKLTKGCVNIVVLDDHSETAFHQINSVLSKDVSYIRLDSNIGRSKIRNKFLEYTDSDYLLFIDCDSTIVDDRYIRCYQEYLDQHQPSVVVGSSVYQKKQPKRLYKLRWSYGSKIESQSTEERKVNANTTFKTNNFIISKGCFQKVSFNEKLSGYGHEDTLFGYELNKNNIEIQHLNNPVLNGDLDTNEEFLLKTEEGLGNLLKVWRMVNFDSQLLEKVRILKYYNRYKNSIWFKMSFLFLGKPIRFLLSMGWSSIVLFNFYKLGYLIQLNSKKR